MEAQITPGYLILSDSGGVGKQTLRCEGTEALTGANDERHGEIIVCRQGELQTLEGGDVSEETTGQRESCACTRYQMRQNRLSLNSEDQRKARWASASGDRSGRRLL